MNNIFTIVKIRRLFLMIFMCLVFFTVTTNVIYAQEQNIDDKTSFVIERNETIDDSSSSGKKVVLSSNNMDFVYEMGKIYVQENNLFVNINNHQVNISNYNWYQVMVNDNRDIFAADIMTNIENPEVLRIVGASIYTKNSGKYLGSEGTMFDINLENIHVMEVLHVSENFKVLRKIIIPINDDFLNKLTVNISQVDLNSEELHAQIIKESLTFEVSYRKKWFQKMRLLK